MKIEEKMRGKGKIGRKKKEREAEESGTAVERRELLATALHNEQLSGVRISTTLRNSCRKQHERGDNLSSIG